MGKEQAQAATTTTAEPSETSGSETPSQADVSNLSLKQLDELFTTGKVEIAPPASGGGESQTLTQDTGKAADKPAKGETPPTETTEVETPGDKPAEEAPKDEAIEETPGETPAETPPATETDDLPERFRHKDPTDRAINAVYKAAQASGTAITWAEAERRVKGEPATTEVKTEATQPTTSDLRGTVATLESELKESETALDAALEAFDKIEDDQLYTSEHKKVQKDIATLTRAVAKKGAELIDRKNELREVEVEEKAEIARQQKEHRSGRDKAKARAIELYPDAADEKSELGKAVSDRIAEMRDPKHPDHSTLYADSAPLTVTATVAAEMGIAPAKKAAASATKTPPPTAAADKGAQRTAASPPSGGKTSVKTEQPAEERKKTVEYLRNEASLAELDAVFGADKNPYLIALGQ